MEDKSLDNQKSFGGWYIVFPIAISLLVLIIELIIKLLIYKRRGLDGQSWGSLFLWFFIVSIICWLGSFAWFLFMSRPKGKGEVRCHSREFLENKIVEEFKRKLGVVVVPFTETGDSHSHTSKFGDSWVYSNLFRYNDPSRPRKLIVAIRMEEGKEDKMSADQLPFNPTQAETERRRHIICNGLSDNPEKIDRARTRVIDPMSGRTTETSIETHKDEDDDDDEETK